MAQSRTKQLLVEGEDDKFAIVGVLQHHVEWPGQRGKWPVLIEAVGSVSEILNANFVRTKLKESDFEVLGFVIDADDEPPSRWNSFRAICHSQFPDLPEKLPTAGLVTEVQFGLRLGFWLMPDCSSSGMLETFLKYLVPPPAEALWKHSEQAFEVARTLGAPCRSVHHDKARIHTWLAWQDPPGEGPGRALVRKTLDPKAASAVAFVAWFKQLYLL